MADLGGIGRGLLKGARSAAEKAESAVRRGRSDDEPREEPPPDERMDLAGEADEHPDDAEIRDIVERLNAIIDARRPPAGPITQPWSVGLGDLVGDIPGFPRRLDGLARRLDRFGGVAITPETIAFDGEDVEWEDVTEVRVRHVLDYLVDDAVEQQLERLPLPPFPGRKRVLEALGKAVLTWSLVLAKEQLEKPSFDLRVPAEIDYRGRFRSTKTLGGGVVAAIMLADPSVSASVIATAQAKGIPVVQADNELNAAIDRSAELRQKIAKIQAELDRFGDRFGRPPAR
jgi:hypothetical protein